MNELFRKISLPAFLLVIIATYPSFVLAGSIIQVESAVIFNTSCARCHEGECSGRMTFHLPKNAADQHIRHYGGELSKETIRQLFELLRYMKEKCSFYPLTITLAHDQIWGSDKLEKFRNPSNKAYFIPLGRLQPGLYQLLFEGLNDYSNSCIEIINSEFDFVDTKKINEGSEKISLQFMADEVSEYYLRITARNSISIKSIELLGSEKNNANH